MKQLVLLGGGHAHVHVLRTLITQPLHDAEVTLITPYAQQVYSGMLPGWIAGHYDIEDCVIPLAPLAEAAGVRFVQSAATGIVLDAGHVECDNGKQIGFDLLSIDSGSVASVAGIPGARDYATAIRPIEQFIDVITTLKSRMSMHRGAPTRITVVGAGAGGVEVALALQFAGQRDGGNEPACAVTLVSAANTLPGSVGPRIERALDAAGVTLLSGVAATSIEQHGVTLADGTTIAADKVIVALGAAAASWPAKSGLTCDAQGYIVTNKYLQSISHPNVFAAGDCATMGDFNRPKSGVYAVRAGPPLAANLRRALNEESLSPYAPQTRSLYLISTGRQYAIGSWGLLSWEGAWVWRWKDRIDRAFMAKYLLPGKPV